MPNDNLRGVADFVHLHTHSEYSVSDGLLRFKNLISAAVDAKMPAIAVTDIHNLFGAVKFYQAATRAKIKPIFGAEVWLCHCPTDKPPWPVVLLVQNQTGWNNLLKLLSKAYLEQTTHGVRVHAQWIIEHNEGLIALSGGLHGEIAQACLHDFEKACECARFYAKHFPDRFYIEIERTGFNQEAAINQQLLTLAETLDLPVAASNNVRFLTPDDFLAHEARVCIHNGQMLADPRREKQYTQEQYLKSKEQMASLFADIPEALINTVNIAKRCNHRLSLGDAFLPNFPIPEGMSVESYLAHIANEGLKERLSQLNITDSQPYLERLTMELGVISGMGYPGYFLIVADFIQWAKDNGIPVGPGRGSGAGSLVAYVLKITDLDPLAYDLLFERFLNPERVSMPDFDVDFCMEGRDRVIEYVAQKYGRQAVSQIITFGTMAAKAVVRDVGRVLGQPYGFVDKLAKLIPFELGITLEKALSQEQDLRDRYQNEEEVTHLIDLALKLEGVTRNAGKHAGGVVIAPSRLTDFSPLYCEMGGGNLVTQFDKDDVEAIGLVKFDFLGLRTLTIIDWAVKIINTSLDTPIDIATIPTEDKPTFDLLKACKTTAVFQLESRGMKDLIHRLQPDCFEEIIALVALFRPGPLQSGMVDDFIDRKHGRQAVVYPHPELEPILRPTYGVILYQEQVMQIAQVLAGYSLGAADLLRRAMGKKKPEEMAKQRLIFMEGAVERGVDADVATGIFDLMEKFAGYGFNKSHSAAYALVAYQTAWLKAHYPEAFMAAVCSSDMDNTDKVVSFIEDCYTQKIKVLPPDVNHSHFKFSVVGDKAIRYGLGAIKGVGEGAIENIVAKREDGEYKNLFDFCERIDSRKTNRRTMEALIRAGALESITPNRATAFVNINTAMRSADKNHQNAELGQADLFGEVNIEQTLETVPPWPELDRLQHEKDVLGLYLSGHPLQTYRDEFANFTTCPLLQLQHVGANRVTVAGLIIQLRTVLTKRGDRMAILTLDDGGGRVECAVFSDLFLSSKTVLNKFNIIIIDGELSMDEYTGQKRMRAQQIWDVANARAHFAKCLQLSLPHQATPELIADLQNVLAPYREHKQTPVRFLYSNGKAKLSATSDWQVKLDAQLFNALQALKPSIGVELVY